MFSLLKSTHAFKQDFSSRLRMDCLTFKLTHITFNHGAFTCTWVGSWVIEKQNNQVKLYVSSSLFHLCSGVFHKFSNKTQSSFLYDPFKSLNMWFLWILTKANLSYAFSPLNICGIFGSRQILVMPSLPHPILVNLCGVHGRWLIHTYNAYVA
jgi:hypothetical protein